MENENAQHLSSANENEYLTVEEASEALGVKPSVVRNYLYQGKLRTFKFKTLTLLKKRDIEAWKNR